MPNIMEIEIPNDTIPQLPTVNVDANSGFEADGDDARETGPTYIMIELDGSMVERVTHWANLLAVTAGYIEGVRRGDITGLVDGGELMELLDAVAIQPEGLL